jgi:hypothetical protein
MNTGDGAQRTSCWWHAAARGRLFNVIDVVKRLKAEARTGCQGRMADCLSLLISRLCERRSVIVTTDSHSPSDRHSRHEQRY